MDPSFFDSALGPNPSSVAMSSWLLVLSFCLLVIILSFLNKMPDVTFIHSFFSRNND